MTTYQTSSLAKAPRTVAPDGSSVSILVAASRGSMAHFELGPGETSLAVAHRTVEEVWFFLSGRGEMWRKLDRGEDVVAVEPGTSLSLPTGTHFQFRCLGSEPLCAVGVTMPPWPGDDEAYTVDGKWKGGDT